MKINVILDDSVAFDLQRIITRLEGINVRLDGVISAMHQRNIDQRNFGTSALELLKRGKTHRSKR